MLRTLPIGVGFLGSSILILNRVLTVAPTQEQTRSDALGLLMAAVLVLVGILARQAQPKTAEVVAIEAPRGTELGTTDLTLAEELRWFGEALQERTATVSLLVWYRGETLLKQGYLSSGKFTLGPIVERVLKTQKPVYLVSLTLFPGRVEFAYLPEGIQAIVCHPLGTDGVVCLASDRIRSYSPQDLGWIETLSERLAQRLEL
jgi:Cofactor assembly of complex C subunit B, CCB2/CCB4